MNSGKNMIACKQIAYVTMGVPDLALMETFLTDFGMVPAYRTSDSVYFRGASSIPYIYVAKQSSQNKIISYTFEAATEDDLHAAAKVPGASAVEDIDGPAGGKRVRLVTPGGFHVDVAHGMKPVDELPLRESYELNFMDRKRRFNTNLRPSRHEPGLVNKLGHLVPYTLKQQDDVEWYMEYFGLLASDHICEPGNADNVLATFLRFDRGDEFVDHHVLLVSGAPRIGCHHTSFEMCDFDAVASAHDYLLSKGWQLDVGYGRHYLGSLIYDYWFDPFGNRIEHYTDTDKVNASYQPVYFTGTADETTQWGPLPPEEFFLPEYDFARHDEFLTRKGF